MKKQNRIDEIVKELQQINEQLNNSTLNNPTKYNDVRRQVTINMLNKADSEELVDMIGTWWCEKEMKRKKN